MVYGTVYDAMGWIVTCQGATFMYDATGHGMTISSTASRRSDKSRTLDDIDRKLDLLGGRH
jgi:hypothetical protein